MPDVPHCRDWDARYGWDLLAEYGPTYDSYIAVHLTVRLANG